MNFACLPVGTSRISMRAAILMMFSLNLATFSNGFKSCSSRRSCSELATKIYHGRNLQTGRQPKSASRLAPSPVVFQNRPVLLRHRGPLFSSDTDDDESTSGGIFADPDVTFESMGIKSPILLDRLEKLKITRPTKVQASTFDSLSAIPREDITLGSETGSGKTLAYLLPLLDDILQRKQQQPDDLGYMFARAMILVPNKELVQQVARMAMALSGGPDSLVGGGVGAPIVKQMPTEDNPPSEQDVVRVAIMPGGLKEPTDFQPFRNSQMEKEKPVDLVISTPAAVGALGINPKNINLFADIATLVLDEADMLLDGGYIRPLDQVFLGYRRADKLDQIHGVPKTQHVFVAATLPDFGLRSVDAYLQRRFPYAKRITVDGMHNARHYGLNQPTVWVELESKKDRLKYFQELLNNAPEEGGLKGQKIMLFVNSVDDVEGVYDALDQNGVSALPYHAKMALAERTQNLDRFRKYDPDSAEEAEDAVSILVCTDLASRGVDIPGVQTIVQLQFAGNVVAHLHRMGRCGRAGQRTGRGVVFYNEKERELVEVVREAEEQQEKMTLKGQDVLELDEEGNVVKQGTVHNAFSRKRGFTKKRKKQRQESKPNQ